MWDKSTCWPAAALRIRSTGLVRTEILHVYSVVQSLWSQIHFGGWWSPLKRSTLLPRPTTAAAVHAVAGSRIIYTACYTRSAGTHAKCVMAAYLHLSLSCAQRVPAVSLPLCVKESGLCYQVSQRSTDLNLGPNKMQRVKATFTFFINRRVVTLYHRLYARSNICNATFLKRSEDDPLSIPGGNSKHNIQMCKIISGSIIHTSL